MGFNFSVEAKVMNFRSLAKSLRRLMLRVYPMDAHLWSQCCGPQGGQSRGLPTQSRDSDVFSHEPPHRPYALTQSDALRGSLDWARDADDCERRKRHSP